MAVQEHRQEIHEPSRLIRRLGQARSLLLIAALVFAALVGLDGLTVLPALVAFLVIGGAVLLRDSSLPSSEGALLYGNIATPAIADRIVDGVISALPDPAIALP